MQTPSYPYISVKRKEVTMGQATVTSKGQLTIPADIREEFGIQPGHRIVFFKQVDGELGVKLIRHRKGAGRGLLRGYGDRLGGAPLDEAIDRAIREAMADKFGSLSSKP
jgi:antitoxin PrlF